MGNPPAKPQGGHAGKKRAHPGSPHFDAANEGPESDGKDGSAAPPRRTRIKTIRMQNFLPFEDCSFSPGPQLNLVVGPNGSGKSSTVAAIALGLSDKAGLTAMQRGGFKEYIRKDQTCGEVEIHLKKPDGTIIMILRKIHRDRPDGKESQFYLDGREVPASQINKLSTSLNINIGNSCHFLPQEMVQEFSKSASNPMKLLELFIEASGGKEMLVLHKELIEHSRNFKNASGEFEKNTGLKEGWEKQQEELQEEARKNERATEILWEVEKREGKRPYIVKQDAKKTYKLHHAEMVEEDKKLQEVAAELTDVNRENTDLKKEVEAAEKEGRVKATEAREMEVSLKGGPEGRPPSMTDTMEQQGEQLGAFDDEEDRLRQDVRRCEKDVREQEKEIEKLRRDGQVEQKVDPRIDEKIAAAVATRRQRHAASERALKDAGAVEPRLREVREERHAAEQKVEEAADGKRRRVAHLRSIEHRLFQQYEAVQEMQRNGEFKMHVFGPMCLEVDVQGNVPKLAVYVDEMLGKEGRAFLVQCQADEDKITKSANQTVKQISVFNFEKRRPAFPAPPRPPKEVLDYYGISGYLIDFVDAPAQVMEFLRNAANLNVVPIGNETSFNKREEMALDPRLREVTKDKKILNLLAGKSIFTPTRRFTVFYSFYGSQAPQYTDKFYWDENRCKVTLGRPAAELQHLRQVVAAKVAEEKDLAEKVAPLQEEARRLRAMFDESQAKCKELSDQKHNVKVLEDKIKRCEVKIKQAKEEGARISRTKVPEIAVKRKKLLGERAALARQAAAILDALVSKYLLGAAADMNAQPLMNQLNAVQDRLREVKGRFNAAERAQADMKVAYDRAKLAYEQASEALKGNEASADVQATFKETPNNLEELDQQLDEYRGEFEDLGHTLDVSRELVNVANLLAEVNKKLRECEKIKEQGSKMVEARKAEWLDGADGRIGLRELVKDASEVFSDFFSRMRNVGEVRLDEFKDAAGEDDFEKYGLQILVKFRQETELAALNGRRQSGGECSVSTMCFILALHKLSNVPLRVVDEINQGMDSAYEKAVFEFIVELNCREDAPQCFLITPKLQADILKGVESTGHISVMQVLKGPGLSVCEDGHL